MSQGFKDLTVYKKAFDLSMEIFEISKSFPEEGKYALTDQIRRSSRSVCVRSKSSDADMENSETQVWLHFSLKCVYIEQKTHDELLERSLHVGRLLNHTVENPEKMSPTNEKLEKV